jgi:hypothetical protein
MIETCLGQGEVGEEEELPQLQPQEVQAAGRKHQAREDMAEQEVQVAHLSEVMTWAEPGPLAEAVERGELKRCDGVPVGQGALEHLVMGSLDSLKLYRTTHAITT